MWGRVAFRGCSFAPSPSGRSPPCSPVRRRGASFLSSGRVSRLTDGRYSPVGNPSAVAPFASGGIGRPSSSRGKRAGSIGQPSEPHPPNSRRQNEGRAVSAGGVAGCGWWVKSRVIRSACCCQRSRSALRSSIWLSSWRRSLSRSSRSFSNICTKDAGCSVCCSGVSWRSITCCAGYTRKSSAGSICHCCKSFRVALNLPALIASSMVDFCFPVALAASPSVKNDMFGPLCVGCLSFD